MTVTLELIRRFLGATWPYLLAALAGGILVGKVEEFRITKLKAEINQIKTDVVGCRQANSTNIETIGALQADQARREGICNDRLKGRNRLVKRLIEIDTLPKGSRTAEGKNHATGAEGVAPLSVRNTGGDHVQDDSDVDGSGDDLLLVELNRMYGRESGGKNGVDKTGGSDAAGASGILPGQMATDGEVMYCLDAESAKALLKNRAIGDNYADELSLILEAINAADK